MAIDPRVVMKTTTNGDPEIIKQERRKKARQKLVDAMQGKKAPPVYGLGDALAAVGNPIAAGLWQRRLDRKKG